MEKKFNSGKNPYDMYSSRLIDKYIEVFLTIFLGMDAKLIRRKDRILKRDKEIRVDHLYEVEIDGEIHILNIEDQLIYNKKIKSRQSLYYGIIDSEANKKDFPIISIFVIFLPPKNFKAKIREINYSDLNSNGIYKKDKLIITSINKVDPKVILENKLSQFIPFLPFMREVKDEKERKYLYKEAMLQIEDIKDNDERENIERYFLIFFNKKFGDLKLIKELTNMSTKELVKKYNLRNIIEDVVKEEKKEWIKEGYTKGEVDGYSKGEVDGYSKGEVEGYTKGEVDGYSKGEKKEKRNIAKNMKYLGISVNQITQATGLSLEEIEKL